MHTYRFFSDYDIKLSRKYILFLSRVKIGEVKIKRIREKFDFYLQMF